MVDSNLYKMTDITLDKKELYSVLHNSDSDFYGSLLRRWHLDSDYQKKFKQGVNDYINILQNLKKTHEFLLNCLSKINKINNQNTAFDKDLLKSKRQEVIQAQEILSDIFCYFKENGSDLSDDIEINFVAESLLEFYGAKVDDLTGFGFNNFIPLIDDVPDDNFDELLKQNDDLEKQGYKFTMLTGRMNKNVEVYSVIPLPTKVIFNVIQYMILEIEDIAFCLTTD